MTSYREYYAACRAAYAAGGDALDLYRLGVRVQAPGPAGPGDLFTLGPAYRETLAELAAELDARIRGGVGLYHNPDARARELAVQLDAFWDIAALERLAAMLVPQAERAILGCFGLVNQVNLIRNRSTTSPPASSWLWHYDNKPDEAFKILVYLNDVDEGGGAFEYLRCPSTGEVIRIDSSRVSPERADPPRWPHSRVPAAAIDEYRTMGYEPFQVLGPAGTLIAFDNNCIHRATIPRRGHRDAVILNLRPCHDQVRPFISPRSTGSWSFNVKQWIPDLVEIPMNP